jgi:hypothetical protein
MNDRRDLGDPSVPQQFVPTKGCTPFNWEQLGNKIPLFLPRFTLPSNVRATESSGVMVRAVGIEPTAQDWEFKLCRRTEFQSD